MSWASRREFALRLATVAVAGSGALTSPVRAQSGTAGEISQLSAERSDEGLFITATLDFELPRAVEDALSKGIPIQFVAEVEVLRPRWYWWERRSAAAQRVWRLTYQPLTRRYRVSLGAGGGAGGSIGQNFEGLPEALAGMRRIARWRVLEARDLEDDARDARLAVELRFRLDTAALPRPLQISVGNQPEWNLAWVRRATVTLATP